MNVTPLIISGTARSGSTLLCRLLDLHSRMAVASDPYLPLFRALRNDLLRNWPGFEPDRPFQDYYFSQALLAEMHALQGASLEVETGELDWDRLLNSLKSRAAHESADILPFLDQLPGANWQVIFAQSLALIQAARPAPNLAYVGFKEVWITEFIPLLARIWPQGRFILIQRDPRAVLSSMLEVANQDPSQVAHILSYLRHWRKHVALTQMLLNSVWAQQVISVRYEDLLTAPEAEITRLCKFLNLAFEPDMLNPNRSPNYVTGQTWQGNSSFENQTQGLSPQLAETWRKRLDPDLIRLAEFVLEAEMKLLNYPLTGPTHSTGLLACLLKQTGQPVSWRSDFGDLQQDWGFELFRRELLLSPALDWPPELLERSFLFADIYPKLHGVMRA